jgi:hypothetical protein
MSYVPKDGGHDNGTVRRLVYTTLGTADKPRTG